MYIQLRFLSFDMARSFVFFFNPSAVSFSPRENCRVYFLSSHHVKILDTLFFFFYKNIFYKNIEAEICEILRIF